MASINVKNQDEFNALSWQDKFGYMKENPNSMITNNEVLRVKQKLETDPTDTAKNYAAGITALRSGESLGNILGDNFDKNIYGYQGASDNFKRQGTTPQSATQTAPLTQGSQGNVVAARDYINSISGSRGANYNIGFSNGFVTVNGRSLKPEYIENGVAYIKRSDVDGLLSSIDAERNRDSNRGILNENEIKWQEDFANSYDKLKNREAFSYSVKDDPIYREFEDYYLKQAEKDAKDVIANAGANTYGVTNLGAIVAADALKRDRVDALATYQKQFRDDAYNRYLDEIELKNADLDLVRNLRSEDLERNWNVHRTDIDDERYADEWDMQKRQYLQQLDKGNLELENMSRQNELAGTQYANEIAKENGGYYPAWAANFSLSKGSNPYYREDVENERALDLADKQYAQKFKWDTELLDYQNNADINKYWQTTGAKKSSSGGTGLTSKYYQKASSAFKTINSALEDESGAVPIVQDAAGNWSIKEGATQATINAIEEAIANNTKDGLTQEEKMQIMTDLGLTKYSADGDGGQKSELEKYFGW